jgi:hypothetical protein
MICSPELELSSRRRSVVIGVSEDFFIGVLLPVS